MIKILVIFLGIGILFFIVLTILCAMVLAGRSEEENKSIRTETQKSNRNAMLCPQCKVGQKSYALDKHSEECPYIVFWKNGKCRFYVPLEKQTKTGMFSRDKKRMTLNNKKTKNT